MYSAVIGIYFRVSLGKSCNKCECFGVVNRAGINLLDYNLFPKIAFAVSDESKCVSSVLRADVPR